MKTRYSFRRAGSLVAAVAIATGAAHAFAAMSVDTRAPLAATLLPTVSVVADAARPDAEAHWHVAGDAPLQVTLMPTVYVSAQAEPLAAVQLPTVRVSAPAMAMQHRENAVAARTQVADPITPIAMQSARVANTGNGLDDAGDDAMRSYGLEVKPE